MKNERDIEFTASPALDSMTQGVDFTPETGTTGSTSGTMGSSTGTMGASGAGTTAGYAQDGGRMDQAKEKAQQLISTAQERVAEKVTTRIDEQRHRAAHRLSDVAETIRSSGDSLPAGADGISRYINQAADRVDEVATFLHDSELGDIVGTVEDFARRQPAAFLGGAFALGILGARFLKSTQQGMMPRHEMRERWSTGSADVHSRVQYDTGRVESPEDAVSRPNAPGYAPPQERGEYM